MASQDLSRKMPLVSARAWAMSRAVEVWSNFGYEITKDVIVLWALDFDLKDTK
jgi:hypothetical protein